MFDVGGGELLLIVLAILLLFGPKKIPEVATMVGKGMRKVRQAQDEFTQHIRDVATDMERSTDSPVQPTLAESSVPPELHVDIEADASDESSSPSETPPEIIIQPSQGSVSR